MGSNLSVFDAPLAKEASTEVGPSHRRIIQITEREPRLFGERTAVKIKRGVHWIVRALVAGVLAASMAVGLTLLGMCLVLGLGYTLSVPLIAGLGVLAIATVGAAIFRAVNRLAFMSKVDAFLHMVGITMTIVPKYRDETSLADLVDPDAFSTGPVFTIALTPLHDLGLKAGGALPVAEGVSVEQRAKVTTNLHPTN